MSTQFTCTSLPTLSFALFRFFNGVWNCLYFQVPPVWGLRFLSFFFLFFFLGHVASLKLSWGLRIRIPEFPSSYPASNSEANNFLYTTGSSSSICEIRILSTLHRRFDEPEFSKICCHQKSIVSYWELEQRMLIAWYTLWALRLCWVREFVAELKLNIVVRGGVEKWDKFDLLAFSR